MSKALADAKRMAGAGGGGGGGGAAGAGGGGGGGGVTMGVYAQIVNREVKKNWRFPQTGAKQPLLAVVEVHIDKDGRIQDYRLVQSSGAPVFDASTVKSVADTQTLPPPPTGLTVLQLRFSSQELGR